MSCIFAIRYLGGAKGRHWFLAKEKYSVCLSPTGDSCDCMHGTMEISRRKSASCKHIKAAKKLLKVMKGGKNRKHKNA